MNSLKWGDQIEADALALVRTVGDKGWEAKLAAYLGKRKTLTERYAKERERAMP